MNYWGTVPMSCGPYRVIVDRMVVGGNGLKGRRVCICESPARGSKDVAEFQVLEAPGRNEKKVLRIEFGVSLGS